MVKIDRDDKASDQNSKIYIIGISQSLILTSVILSILSDVKSR